MLADLFRAVITVRQALDPGTSTHQRRTELVGRFAGHGNPKPVTVSIDRGTIGPDAHGHAGNQETKLQERQPGETTSERDPAIVNLAEVLSDNWRVHPVEFVDVSEHLGIIGVD